MTFAVFAFASCVTEVDDVFKKSASERMEEAIREAKSILSDSKNGWRMEYYGNTEYGGYNVFVKFEGDSVEVASEKVGASHNAGVDANGNVVTAKSHFKVEQSMGMVLSFDDYNDVFHYFSHPRNSDYGTNGEGFEGDFEFRIASISAEKIELVGKKHDTKIVMYPMDSNSSFGDNYKDQWADYLKQVEATDAYMLSRSYTLEVDGSEEMVPVISNYRRLRFTVTDKETGFRSYVYAPFCITPNGYVFYESVNVNDVDISGFNKGDTDEFFAASNNDKVKLVTEVPTIYDTFINGTWYLTYEDMGEYGKGQWNTLLEKLATAENGKRARLYFAVIGDVTGSKPYWGFEMNAGSMGVQIGGISFSTVKDENGQDYTDRIKLTRNARSDANNSIVNKYYQNNRYGVRSAMDPFCGGYGHTFKLSTDNVRHPSYIIMEDVDDPSNVIKVWAESKGFPFGDLDNDDKDK